MESAGNSLITISEAEEVVNVQSGVTKQLRTPLMIILGALTVVVATLLILLILSLRGSRTGWESVLPFLDSEQLDSLQTN